MKDLIWIRKFQLLEVWFSALEKLSRGVREFLKSSIAICRDKAAAGAAARTAALAKRKIAQERPFKSRSVSQRAISR